MEIKDLINKAVSANPSIVTPMLNKDGRLERKVHQVWIDDKQDRVFVFRESTSVPGQFSKDIYQLSTRKFLEEDKEKYPSLPIFPNGAFEHILFSGIRCSAMIRLDKAYLTSLATSLHLVAMKNK